MITAVLFFFLFLLAIAFFIASVQVVIAFVGGIAAIIAIYCHVKLSQWRKTVPSSTKCPQCGSTMLIETINTGAEIGAAGTTVLGNIGIASAHTTNTFGQLMTCRKCGYQQHRITKQIIDSQIQRFTNKRNIWGCIAVFIAVISLILQMYVTQ